MAIKRFHDNLPAPARLHTGAGWVPDDQTRFGHLLAEAWKDRREPKPLAREEARFRHSDGGACDRLVAYAALDLEPSDPMDLAGIWVTEQGTLIHDAWQTELQARYPDAHVEVEVGEGDRAGHVDAVVSILQDVGSKVICIEGKTVGGYAYQLAVGAKGSAEGPRHTAVTQGALNAADVDADELVIIYWARDAISIQQAARKGITAESGRFVAEWTLARADYEPIARAEKARVHAILGGLDRGWLPARHIPDPTLPTGHLILDPSNGAWTEFNEAGAAVDAGTTWQCVYCRYQTLCQGTSAQAQPITDFKPEEDNHG